MAQERVERRLAAILAADMVGYSRLIGVDEAGTIARQKVHRKELIDPKIAEQGGRIVKTTGDGLLVEFASAVDAVLCAVEIQRAMGAREAEVPEDRRIAYLHPARGYVLTAQIDRSDGLATANSPID